MAAFSYQAYNAKGRREKGVIEADSERAARQALRAKGLLAESVVAVQDTAVAAKAGGAKHDTAGSAWTRFKHKLTAGRNKISANDLALLTRQLATLLASSIPIDEALSSVAEQSTKTQVKATLLGVRSKVLTGYSLAVSLADFPRAFPKLFRVTVAAGEQSGQLDKALLRLADYTEKQHKIRRKVTQALVYPSMMAGVASLVVVFLILYVVPKIIGVFQESHMALPTPTIILLAISGFLQNYGLYFLIFLVIALYFWRKLLKRESVRRRFDSFLLKLPVIGRTMLVLNCARFARTFGILMSASVPVLEALNNAAQLITPLPMREAVLESVADVREGGTIYAALRKTQYFPPMFLHLLASGEKSGHLEEMLTKVADNQDTEVEAVLQSVLTLFEPIMILVMGSVVLFIVLAVLLPIFSMDQFNG